MKPTTTWRGRRTLSSRWSRRDLPYRSFRPQVEALENRWLPSTITFVQNIGSNSNFSSDPTATFSSIDIPITAGHDVGANHSIFVELAVDPGSGAVPTVTDSA